MRLQNEATIRRYRIVRLEGTRQVSRKVEHSTLKQFSPGRELVKANFVKIPYRFAGIISAEAARKKAELEYNHYRALIDAQPRQADRDFEQAVKQFEKQPKPNRPGILKP